MAEIGEVKIGDVIDNKYEIVAKIGEGGMSKVYLAMDRRLNKQWAVKEAKKKPGKNSEIYELTPMAEAGLLKGLNHENIVRIVDIIEERGYLYIVEDFVEGNSLLEKLKEGPSNPDDVVNWGIQLCDTLQYLHTLKEPIIYRDMKPENVQLDPDGKKVVLLDFGIAKIYKPQNTSDTNILGTRGYAAPEQFDINRQSDGRTDIYSLGVTLRALLMGKKPSDVLFHEDIRKFNPEVTDGLVKVLAKATNNNPDKRYQTAAEFKTALENYHNYDDAVIRMKKRKLSSFRGLLAASVALFLVGAVLLPISNVVRNSDYESNLTNGEYKECIEINSSRSDAYFDYLAHEIDSRGVTAAASLGVSDDETDNADISDTYRDISDEEERRAFALWMAFVSDRCNFTDDDYFSSPSDYYSDLACDFDDSVSLNIDCTDENFVEEKLTSSEDSEVNIYMAIARIRLFYDDVSQKADNSLNKGTGDKISDKGLENIYNNIEEINEWLNENRETLEKETGYEEHELNGIFEYVSYSNVYGGDDVENFYVYLVKLECDVLLYYDEEEVLGDYDTLKALVNTESGYVTEKLLNSFKPST